MITNKVFVTVTKCIFNHDSKDISTVHIFAIDRYYRFRDTDFRKLLIGLWFARKSLQMIENLQNVRKFLPKEISTDIIAKVTL